MTFRHGLLVLLACSCFLGCDSSKPKPPAFHVAGHVTNGSSASAEGTIQFSPTDISSGAIAVSAPITDGKFDLPAVVKGKYMVTISSEIPPAAGTVVGSDYKAKKSNLVVPKKFKDGVPVEITAEKLDLTFDLAAK